MARPRIFLSSTFYDLHQSREDLERFIRAMGYECVRHESGAIPYARNVGLENSAYREVELCDILVTIIGGRFGSESKEMGGNSVTQNEIIRALDKGIQVYIFVEQNTLTEYEVWRINKNNKDMKYRFADDPRIYEFVDRLYSLPNNNPIVGFRNIVEITSYLQEQWAGLFQRYLSQQLRMKEVAIVEDMRGIASTLREMVDFLSVSNKDKDLALQSILLTNHPIFSRLAKATGTGYRIFFTNHDEMAAWFKERGWVPGDSEMYSDGSIEEWYKEGSGWVEFKMNFFNDDGSLKNFAASEWDDEWIRFVQPAKTESSSTQARSASVRARRPVTAVNNDDDDIPF